MPDVVVVGSFVQDFAFNTAVFPAPGETRIGRFATGPGGKGFNQAVAANRQDAECLYIGACGRDMFGQQAQAFAEREKLRCGFMLVEGEASGAASIVINETAQNLIVVALGANDYLSVEHINEFADDIRGSKVLVCQLESRLDATVRALQLAREAGVTTLLNPAPINEAMTLDMLDAVDILVPNETEFAFLSQHLLGRTLPENYWTADHDTLHRYCRAFNVPTIIITLGERGCFVSHAQGAEPRSDGPSYYAVPAENVTPVDTTGAGDAFCGGLAAALAQIGTANLRQACQAATRVAGLSTESPGTAPAMPTRAAVRQRFGDTV